MNQILKAAFVSMFDLPPFFLVVVVTLMAIPLIVDLNLTVEAGLRGSMELVRPRLVQVFVFCVLCFIAVLVGMLLCFAGAVLVSMPVVFLAHAHAYLQLRGQNAVSA